MLQPLSRVVGRSCDDCTTMYNNMSVHWRHGDVNFWANSSPTWLNWSLTLRHFWMAEIQPIKLRHTSLRGIVTIHRPTSTSFRSLMSNEKGTLEQNHIGPLLSVKLSGIRCTPVPNSRLSLMTKRTQYSRQTTSAPTLSPAPLQETVQIDSKIQIWQKQHHTLLHIEPQAGSKTRGSTDDKDTTNISSNTAIKLKSNALLMTCRMSVLTPDGLSVEARALLNNASSVSFISERLVHSLSIPRFNQHVRVSGFRVILQRMPIQSVSSFQISPIGSSKRSRHSKSDLWFTAHWLTLDLDRPVASTSYLESTCSLTYCITASGVVLMALSLLLRLILVGCSVVVLPYLQIALLM